MSLQRKPNLQTLRLTPPVGNGTAGDRYLLKLFRDFVFHQVTEEGAPLLDWGLVAEALTKLDAGLARNPPKVTVGLLACNNEGYHGSAGPPWIFAKCNRTRSHAPCAAALHE